MAAGQDRRPGADLPADRLRHGQIGRKTVLEIVVTVFPLPVHRAVDKGEDRRKHGVGHMGKRDRRFAAFGKVLRLLPEHHGGPLGEVPHVHQAERGMDAARLIGPRFTDDRIEVGAEEHVVPVDAVETSQHLAIAPRA